MYEEEIVKKFVISSRRDRCIYELGSPERRKNCILGRIERVFDEKKIICSIRATYGVKSIVDEVRKYTSEKQCYVMSADEYDRQVVDFQTVIDAVYCLGPALFYFPQSGILYYEGEPYSSKTPRWILK